MSAAIAALIGALFGAGASVVAMLIQQRYQNKREILKIAADLALQDYTHRSQLLIDAGGGRMPPVSAFVHYQMRVLEHRSTGKFNPEAVKALTEEYEQILAAYTSLTDERLEAKRHAA